MKKGRLLVLLGLAAVLALAGGGPGPLAPDRAAASTDAPFTLEGELTRGDRLRLDVVVERSSDYAGEAYVVFQLLQDNTPLVINAVPIRGDEWNVTQYFNVSGSAYKVKVFVFDRFDGDAGLPVSLAAPALFQ